MSRYLIDRIAALPNVELHVGTEIAALEGDRATRPDRARPSATATTARPSAARCATCSCSSAPIPTPAGCDGCVETDDKGFIVTGARRRCRCETSLPGVFAIGDVRAGSTKRVAAAVGEGAAVVAQIHSALAEQRRKETPDDCCTHLADDPRRHAERARAARSACKIGSEWVHLRLCRDLRPCRLLRRFAAPPRDRAFPRDAASDHRGL